jgi:hypothetical protein
VIALTGLVPAAADGWRTLFRLSEIDTDSWVLVGGQAVYLLGVEHAARHIRPTDDVDVVVDVRAKQRGTEWLSDWLVERGFELAGIGPDGVGHRFVRPADPGPGNVVFDVLAPEGLARRTAIHTRPPARTVQVPGSRQAFGRSAVVEVAVSSILREPATAGLVRRPTVLGMLVAKAASTTIGGRSNPERDWQDAALLLSLIGDPVAAAAECDRKDRQRLRRLTFLDDRAHPGWAYLDDQSYRRGTATLAILLRT